MTGTPLKQITEEHFASLMRVMFDSINHVLTCCMGNNKGSIMESLLCKTTVIQLLKSFASWLDGREYDNTKYQFWTPLHVWHAFKPTRLKGTYDVISNTTIIT